MPMSSLRPVGIVIDREYIEPLLQRSQRYEIWNRYHQKNKKKDNKRQSDWHVKQYHTNPIFREREKVRLHTYYQANRKTLIAKAVKRHREYGYNKKSYQKRGKWTNRTLQDSGYSRIAAFLRVRHIKPPQNFTLSFRRKMWAWTFAHP